MKTSVPASPGARKGNRRMVKIVGGEDFVNDAADMLTEPLAVFERRCAAIYPDWPAFVAWVDDRRYNLFAIVAAVVIGAALLWLPASAQPDPCEACQTEHGAACPCLPVQEEPDPVGGTIPPVAGIACIPDGPQPDISGCDDKVFMPVMLVGDVTGEGGSGILPVRSAP